MGYELYHHGILGQKWGVRRYQNPDGSYTEAGLARRNKISSNEKFQAREKKQALKVSNKRIKDTVDYAKIATDSYEKHVKKHPEQSLLNETMRSLALGIIHDAQTEMRLKDLIENDVLKAGRDYIVSKRDNKIVLYDKRLYDAYTNNKTIRNN